MTSIRSKYFKAVDFVITTDRGSSKAVEGSPTKKGRVKTEKTEGSASKIACSERFSFPFLIE